jgi:hypothetical protein
MAIRKSGISGIPFGNTAARPASPSLGQPYFNGQTARLELYTDTGWQNIVQETPGVASSSGTYNQSAGSGTFTISGTNFVDGAIAYAVGTNGTEYQATTTTYNSLVQLTVVFSNLSAEYEPYDIKVTNPSNLFGLLPDAFYINDSPVWSTSSGSLGTVNNGSVSIQLSATDDESSTITYSVTSGSLPNGLSLSSAGLISGTMSANPATYTFTVSASDGINTAVTRSFSIIVPLPTITGGTITVAGDYRIHTFTSTGTFSTNAASLNADYLVVAGGGGGGRNNSGSQGGAGGGGAGGLRSTVTATGGGGSLNSAVSLTAQDYTVTVGAGGAGATSTNKGSEGVNSTFYTVTSIGGGGGGADTFTAGNGGSGGGGGPTAQTAGGTGTANQGFAGGQAGSGGWSAAGGGGAGAVGNRPTSIGGPGNGGAGGAGVAVSISGSSVTYAGGGGGGGYGDSGNVSPVGGAGGAGGGGNGGKNSDATSGAANTGSGGGGMGTQTPTVYNSAAGGSGIVIVRYLKSVVGL